MAASVMVGDPVIVAGRLYTRDWTDDAGNHRTLYELEAVAVGHDLARGRSRFLRNRPSVATSTVEDAEAERRVHGEATEPVPDAHAPALLDDRPFDDGFEGLEFAGPRVGPGLSDDLDSRPAGDFDEAADPFDDVADQDGGERDDPVTARPGGATEPDEPDGPAPAGDTEGVTPTGRGRRGGRRAPVLA